MKFKANHVSITDLLQDNTIPPTQHTLIVLSFDTGVYVT